MEQQDDKLERYLGEFRPRDVRSLELPRQSGNGWIKQLAAAAVVVLAGSISVWFVARTSRKASETAAPQEVQSAPVPTTAPLQKSLSTLALTRLALEDREQFDALMTAESRNVLPNLQGAESTLRVLAKE